MYCIDLKHCPLQRLELIKLQLRQQSKGGESDEHVKVISLSPEQAVSLSLF